MSTIDPEILELFQEESIRQLQELESCLLEVETSGFTMESTDAMFRVVHSMKGSSGYLKLEALVRLTNSIENLFVQIKNGLQLNEDQVSYLFHCADRLKELVLEPEGNSFDCVDEEVNTVESFLSAEGQEELARKKDLKIEKVEGVAQVLGKATLKAIPKEIDKGHTVYCLSFTPAVDMEELTIDQYIGLLKSLGSILESSPSLEEIEKNPQDSCKICFSCALEPEFILDGLALPQSCIAQVGLEDLEGLNKEPRVEAEISGIQGEQEEQKIDETSLEIEASPEVQEIPDSTTRPESTQTEVKSVKTSPPESPDSVSGATDSAQTIALKLEQVDRMERISSDLNVLAQRLTSTIGQQRYENVELNQLLKRLVATCELTNQEVVALKLQHLNRFLKPLRRFSRDLGRKYRKKVLVSNLCSKSLVEEIFVEPVCESFKILMESMMESLERSSSVETDRYSFHLNALRRGYMLLLTLGLELPNLPKDGLQLTVPEEVEEILREYDAWPEIEIEGNTLQAEIHLPYSSVVQPALRVMVGSLELLLPRKLVAEVMPVNKEDLVFDHQDKDQNQVIWRGQYIPVLFLRERVGEELSSNWTKSVMVVVDSAKGSYALAVDKILGMELSPLEKLPLYFGNSSVMSHCSLTSDGNILCCLDLHKIEDEMNFPRREERKLEKEESEDQFENDYLVIRDHDSGFAAFPIQYIQCVVPITSLNASRTRDSSYIVYQDNTYRLVGCEGRSLDDEGLTKCKQVIIPSQEVNKQALAFVEVVEQKSWSALRRREGFIQEDGRWIQILEESVLRKGAM